PPVLLRQMPVQGRRRDPVRRAVRRPPDFPRQLRLVRQRLPGGRGLCGRRVSAAVRPVRGTREQRVRSEGLRWLRKLRRGNRSVPARVPVRIALLRRSMRRVQPWYPHHVLRVEWSALRVRRRGSMRAIRLLPKVWEGLSRQGGQRWSLVLRRPLYLRAQSVGKSSLLPPRPT